MASEGTGQSAGARGRPFKKGQSGNPAGKPKGARHKTTLAIQALLDGEAEALTAQAIRLAMAGDPTALKICFDRILPARKDRHVAFAMPPIKTAADALAAANALLAALAAGELTPSEASEIGKLIDGHVRTIEATELEERLQRLERAISQ